MYMWRSTTGITAKRLDADLLLLFMMGGELHGVAICSNPVARRADDGLTLEVSRICTDGTHNACSILYGACARIAKEMGFRKIQTYILASESGTSLKASGWICEGQAGQISWMHKPSERTKERNAFQQMELFNSQKKPPEEMKQRWAKYFGQESEGKNEIHH